MNQYDVVVVGGGLGGLSAGAILAKKGYRVHLIEPHDKVGGFATNFSRKKYRMEVAVHVLDGAHPYNLRNELFEFLDVDRHVKFVTLPEFYKCHYEGESVVVENEFVKARESLLARFPRERAGIDEFFREMLECEVKMYEIAMRDPALPTNHPLFSALYPQMRRLTQTSIGHYVDRLIQDPLLKKALLANVPFYHNNAYELSLCQFLHAQASYLLGGPQYVQGGSQVFSDFLADQIRQNGGQVSLKHEVQCLRVEGGRIEEVIYARTVGDKSVQSCRAKYVVANAPLPLVYKKLLKPSVDADYLRLLDELGSSTSATTLFFGLKKSLKELGNSAYLNIFIEEKKNSQDFNFYENSVGVVDYDIADTRLCLPGSPSADVIFMDQFSNWSKLSPLEYKKRKRLIAAVHIKNMEQRFPGFKDAVEVCEVGTPKTIIRYTASPAGAIYGFAPTCESYSRRFYGFFHGFNTVMVENLYFSSAWSYTPGFSGALIAGVRASKQILKVKRLAD
jgi:phytoene dehydrogenase-like protein